MSKTKLTKLSKLIRYYILSASTAAGSGHPTSSLSAVELMSTLMFGGFFRYDIHKPDHYNNNNDRLIFSKGHASPLYYALWAAAGELSETDLKTFRQFRSVLEGHPSMRFAYTEAATGSLGQGLSVGLGTALAAKFIDRASYRTYVLLGDGEMAEGSVWETMKLAAFYKLNNLTAILDVNRLGQTGQTMAGYNTRDYASRAAAFGWKPIVIDGHNFDQIIKAFEAARSSKNPAMIIAKTIKGKGVSFLENVNGKHGKALKPDEYARAVAELGKVDMQVTGKLALPADGSRPNPMKAKNFLTMPKYNYSIGEEIATRKAYGQALVRIYPKYRDMVVLDADVGDSTFTKTFAEQFPERFFQCFIAEQSMVGAAVGMARRGKLPFVTTFSAFLTRAFDQIRMASYSDAHIVFCGSHAGVSIGQDGPSQMGLEDIAMFRSILNSIVLYPSDAVSCDKLTEEAARYKNICYIRTTRMPTPVIYNKSEQFKVGGSKVLRSSKADKVTIIAAGVTLHEALKAYELLSEKRISARIIDLYSIKPLDTATLKKAATQTKHIITVEDHYVAGGIGEAVSAVLSGKATIHQLAVKKMPRSGTPEQLLSYEGISAQDIARKAETLLRKKR